MAQRETIPLKEARARLGLGREFMRAEIRRGALKVIRLNARVIRVSLAEISEYEARKSA